LFIDMRSMPSSLLVLNTTNGRKRNEEAQKNNFSHLRAKHSPEMPEYHMWLIKKRVYESHSWEGYVI